MAKHSMKKGRIAATQGDTNPGSGGKGTKYRKGKGYRGRQYKRGK
jgi:hypothetical protein